MKTLNATLPQSPAGNRWPLSWVHSFTNPLPIWLNGKFECKALLNDSDFVPHSPL